MAPYLMTGGRWGYRMGNATQDLFIISSMRISKSVLHARIDLDHDRVSFPACGSRDLLACLRSRPLVIPAHQTIIGAKIQLTGRPRHRSLGPEFPDVDETSVWRSRVDRTADVLNGKSKRSPN